VAAALGFIALEHWRPYDGRQRFWRDEFWSDLLFYTLAQSYVLGLVITWIGAALNDLIGLSSWRLFAKWPVAAQFALFFVTHDLYIYLFHRAQHRWRWLWRLHEAHHSTKDVDWLSGSRSHALEILINQTIEFAPLVLLGAHPAVAISKLTIDAVWGMYIHTNIDVRSGWLQYVINGPEMHRWHHAKEVTDGHLNYGTKLAIWDWLFGTAYLPHGLKPQAYGMFGYDVPRGFWAQFWFAYRRSTVLPRSPPGPPASASAQRHARVSQPL
jgi:sterol desaturase/sphingolipid hydroxylase (fatty acid hydroxylase superfamily)